jgi:hypothetical protein
LGAAALFYDDAMQFLRFESRRGGAARAASSTPKQRWILLRRVALAFGVYAMLILITMLASSPFRAGVEAVAATGGWDEDQITFRGGSYGFRILYAVAEVDVFVETATGPVPVHLEMTRLTPFGWSVRQFRVDSDQGPFPG